LKIHRSLVRCLLLLSPIAAFADVTLITGTPGDAYLSSPTGPTPNLNGLLLNFSTLTPFQTFTGSSPYTADGVTISSPDGLMVLPYSTQTVNPNELWDEGANGVADITIATSAATEDIGVGIADSDPVQIELQALGVGGTNLGAPFFVMIPENTVNPGNGYYDVADTASALYGLEILQPVGNVNFSGLAISPLEVAPEPATFPLTAGLLMAMAAGLAWRRRKKA
jgi:hypothetical protein